MHIRKSLSSIVIEFVEIYCRLNLNIDYILTVTYENFMNNI